LKVFRKDTLLDLLPQTDGFFVNTEMLTRAGQLGYQVAEAPVRHRPRLAGSSKVSLWDIPRTLRTLLPFWWTRVLFPVEQETRDSVKADGLRALHFLLLVVVVAALLFFARLDCPLQEPEESRYAEIPREMLRTDNLVLPTLHGRAYYDKPPLLYWLVMGSYQVFGIHDWAARLVPSLAAFFSVLVTCFWGSRVAGRRAGFAAAMILSLSARFVYLGRLLTMNSLLCLWITAALAAAHLALRGPALRWRWWLCSGAACGLGLLTKGPVALALVCMPVFLYRLLDTRTAPMKLRSWMAYLGIAFLLAGPWYLLVAGKDPDFFRYFFWKHNVVRYVTPFDHEKPVYAYLPDLFLGMFPWSLLLLPLGRLLGRRITPRSLCRPPALGFFLIAFLWGLGFYSFAGSKRPGYILAAMPPLALALGCYLDVWLTATTRAVAMLSCSRFAFRATLAVLGTAIVASLLLPSAGLLQPTTSVGLACGGLLASVAVYRFGYLRKPALAWAMCGGITFGVLFLSLHLLVPGYGQKFSLRAEVRPFAALCRNVEVPVVCFPRCWDSVSFYLGRDDVRVYTRAHRRQLITDLGASPRTLAFFKSDHSLEELLRDLPGSLEFVPRGRQANVTVGWVRHKWDAQRLFFAGH
jgi:dolichol-phosphate mannosyltransferase